MSILSPVFRPALDAYRGLDRLLAADRSRALFALIVGLAAGYWLYVPLHELGHAAGCLASGGEVTELEISRLYGGDLWARLVPWIVSGSDYAGRLSGFDDHGSDAIYLATLLGPYALTLFPGVWLVRRSARRQEPVLFGAALGPALAPFLSLTGDAYEIGALAATQIPPWSTAELRHLLRGEDLLLEVRQLAEAGPGAPWGGLVLATATGVVWAFATYAAGSLVARLAGERALDP